MPSRHLVAFLKPLALAIGGALVIWCGAAAFIAVALGHDARTTAPWLAAAKFASLAWVAAIGWRFVWPRLDEREQEVRKAAWFVGSTAAMLVAAPIMVFWFLDGGALLARLLGARGTPGVFFALGSFALGAAQLLGALAARVGLAIRR